MDFFLKNDDHNTTLILYSAPKLFHDSFCLLARNTGAATILGNTNAYVFNTAMYVLPEMALAPVLK